MPEVSPPVCLCNTSPLFYLHQIRRLSLLRQLYGRVLTTPEVAGELDAGAKVGEDVPNLREHPWIEVHPIKIPSYLDLIADLGRGEASVLALGLEQEGRSLLVIDDKLGRRIARLRNLTVTGTAWVLLKGKQAGPIASLHPVLDDLAARGFRLHAQVVADLLAIAGEK
jgi:predicted nucleic acid-binding protein